jgi:uridine phosphorylase
MPYDAEIVTREKQLNIRLSPEEAQRLDRIASHYGLSSAAVLRMLVKREDDSIAREDLRRENNSWSGFVDTLEKALKASRVKGFHVVENPVARTAQVSNGKRGTVVSVDDFYEMIVALPGSKLAEYEWDFDRREYVKKTRKR